ncbi:MAG: DPP IV N-terminal domain-containing protein [Candidatus Zixiibacteriota bacterium]
MFKSKNNFFRKLLFGLFCGLIFLFFLPGSDAFTQDRYFGKNKVQYRDFYWYFIQTQHFDIYYYQNGYTTASFAAEVLEDAYLEIKEQLDYSLRKRIPVILYNSSDQFQQTNVVPDLIEESVGGFTESFKTRVVVPFNGSYEDFRHVLHHELTHAVTFDMLYGNILGSLLSRQYLFRLPLWFAEGYAEYSSRHGWDVEADMILRDATINGYLAPFDYVGGYLVYKEGQSVLLYIAEKYGEEKIAEILSRGRAHLSMDKALKNAIGMDTQTLSEEWMKAMRKEYWPEIASREEPKDFAKQLTFHPKDGSYVNEKPQFSPQGDRLAIFSDRSDYTEIYVISAIDGKVIDRVIKGERSGDLESLHSYVSGLSWSPDGKSLVFVSKSNGKDVLSLVRVKDKKLYKRFKFKFDSIFSPSWNPAGGQIAFVGLENSKSDIYCYDLNDFKLNQLTNDRYDEREPAFSVDGKSIAFSSDRPIDQESLSDSSFIYGHYNIFFLDLEKDKITSLTENKGNNRSPVWSPDGKRICFVSDRNGIRNLYIRELDSEEVYPITNILSGCFSPTWSPDGENIAFSAFHKGGWDVFVLKDIRPINENSEELSLTPFLASQKADTLKEEKKERYKPELDLSSYVFKTGESELDSLVRKSIEDEEIVEDTLAYKLPSGEYKKNKYRLRFTPDLVSGALSYDTFFGFRGQSFIMISDIFGNHTFYLATDLINTIDQSNFQLIYLNSTNRMDFGVGIFHTKYYYIDYWDRLFSDRLYGALGALTLPLSKFTRFDLGLTHLSIDRKYYDPPFDDRAAKVGVVSLSWINDTVLWGITGPVNGSRRMLGFDYSPDISTKSISYRSFWLDYRKYWHFKKGYNVVFRLTGGRSDGKDPEQFFMGGISNWIGPRLATEHIYGVNDLYFATIVTPLRGYKYYEVTGTRYALVNLELRYPFIDQLAMRFPLPILLSRVNGNIFFDIGSAWYDTEKWKGGTTEGGSRLKDLKAGFGFGARANLGIMVLKFDLAWGTDFDSVSAKPISYFSLGAEF